jgi:hypothetical protein
MPPDPRRAHDHLPLLRTTNFRFLGKPGHAADEVK